MITRSRITFLNEAFIEIHTLDHIDRRGKKNPHVPLKIIYKVKIFTCNHYPYLSKFYAQSKNKWLSLPPGADLSHFTSISKLSSKT